MQTIQEENPYQKYYLPQPSMLLSSSPCPLVMVDQPQQSQDVMGIQSRQGMPMLFNYQFNLPNYGCWKPVDTTQVLRKPIKQRKQAKTNRSYAGIKKWTKEEEMLLEKKFEELGPHWARMTSFFPGRTDVNLKNHWSSMMNRKMKESVLEHIQKKPKEEDDIFDIKVNQDLPWYPETQSIEDGFFECSFEL